jgi:hypothetical protein
MFALIISVAAYNRAGQDIDDTIAEGVRDAAETVENTTEEVASGVVDTAEDVGEATELAAERAAAAARLAAVEARLEAEENWQEARQEVAEVRADIAVAYENRIEGEFVAEAREVDQMLANIEDELRQESAGALDALEDAINRLEQDIRTDETG